MTEWMGLYECDPDKNQHCRKTNCYLNGGPCFCTDKPEFAKTIDNGKKVKHKIIYNQKGD